MSKRISVVWKPILALGALVLAGSFVACGPANESEPRAEAKVDDSAPVASETTQPQSGASSRDIPTLDLCALLPVSDVARILEQDPSHGTAEATMGQWSSDCTYSFDRGDGSSDYVMVWAYSPELWAPEVDAEHEEIPGLGDAAYLTSDVSFAEIHVLLEGDVHIETRAATPEQARRLAELAIERLAGT